MHRPAILALTAALLFPCLALASTVDGEGYTVNVEDTAAKVGSPSVVRLVLKAKDGYKVNGEYPTKLAINPSARLKLEKTLLEKGDGKLVDPSTLVFEVPVTAESDGSHDLSGKLSLSVCTPERCLIDKCDWAAKVVAAKAQ